MSYQQKGTGNNKIRFFETHHRSENKAKVIIFISSLHQSVMQPILSIKKINTVRSY